MTLAWLISLIKSSQFDDEANKIGLGKRLEEHFNKTKNTNEVQVQLRWCYISALFLKRKGTSHQIITSLLMNELQKRCEMKNTAVHTSVSPLGKMDLNFLKEGWGGGACRDVHIYRSIIRERRKQIKSTTSAGVCRVWVWGGSAGPMTGSGLFMLVAQS